MTIGHRARAAAIEANVKRGPTIIREDAAELPADLENRLAALEWAVKQPTQDRMIWAAILAVYAIVSGAETGDYRWHGGDSDFTWDVDGERVRMDAETFFAHVQKQFERS